MSPLAQQLLDVIKSSTEGIYEDNAIQSLFPKPFPFAADLTREERVKYWDWDNRTRGGETSRCIDAQTGEKFLFQCEYSESYAAKTYAAFQELKEAGLVESVNCGYNVYAYRLAPKIPYPSQGLKFKGPDRTGSICTDPIN